MHTIYLHGFASGPGSKKAQVFKAAFRERGWSLEIPDLDGGDFEHLTIGGMLERVERRLRARADCSVLIGSSLGGYLAALAASRQPRVEALILMAPAFDLRRRWREVVGEELLSSWKRTGSISVFHHGAGEERPIAYRFFEEAGDHPAYPELGDRPALLLQGRGDEWIPVEVAERFAARNPGVRLRLLDDDHALLGSTDQLLEEAERFLEEAVGVGTLEGTA